MAATVAVAAATWSDGWDNVMVGSTRQLAATATDAIGTPLSGKTFVWSSSDANVATVSTSGLVTGRGAGSAVITATTEGRSGNASITVTATGQEPPPPPPPPPPGGNNMFFNSAEAGCGTDSNILMCDDFEDGEWYAKNCDQVSSLLETDGWCGTIYNNGGMAAGTARCGGVGLKSACAATTGVMSGSTTGNMADHTFVNGQGVSEVWVRFYTKPLSGYRFGAEKMLTFNDGNSGDGGIRWGNLSWNCAASAGSTGQLTMGFPQPMDLCQGQNVGNSISIQAGNWYFYEVHYRLSSPGQANGVFELWVDNCGTTGTSCPATPTLRMRLTNVRNDRTSTNELIRVLWFEAWSNDVSLGERYWDQIKVSKGGPIGFMK